MNLWVLKVSYADISFLSLWNGKCRQEASMTQRILAHGRKCEVINSALGSLGENFYMR